MISQVMTQLNIMLKSEKYQQGKVMIIQLVLLDFVYFKNNYRLIAADLGKQKVLDADSREIHQIIFTGKIKTEVEDTRVII